MERIGDICVFRVDGESRLDRAVRLIADGIRMAREQGCGKLMVVTTGLSGLAVPTVTERLCMVRDWAEAAQGRVTLAVVTHADLIDPERFGVVAAASFGMTGNVFTGEEAALAWLGEQA